MVYDMAFIGGGLAATATLTHLLRQCARRARPWRIAVIDAGGWFGGGVTYSGPAAADTLLQNPVRDMPPCLGDWLRATPLAEIEAWVERLAAKGAARGARAWIARDRAALAAGEVDGLFVPRALYGHVHSQAYGAALTQSPAEVSQITARVQGLSQGAAFRLDLGPNRPALEAARVVLCPGLIPRAPEPGGRRYLNEAPAGLVQALGRGGAILGANAAAMDMLHILDLYGEHLPKGAQISVLSRSGQLPQKFDPNLPENLPPSALLADPTAVKDARQLVATITRDAAAWAAAGIAPAELGARGGMAALMRCLAALPSAERRQVIEAEGRALSLLSRRAVPAYAAAAERLVHSGRVRVEAATVQGVTAGPEGGALLDIKGQAPRAVPCLVDCRGAGHLETTQDPLLRALSNGVLRPNGAGSGFVVDDQLCAAPGLYVLGDLLTGYDGAHGAVWHLQSAPRIETYAKVLAEALLETASASR